MRKPKTFRADAGWRVIVEHEHENGDLAHSIHNVTHWQISRAGGHVLALGPTFDFGDYAGIIDPAGFVHDRPEPWGLDEDRPPQDFAPWFAHRQADAWGTASRNWRLPRGKLTGIPFLDLNPAAGERMGPAIEPRLDAGNPDDAKAIAAEIGALLRRLGIPAPGAN
jgi:hypothetical protein